MPNLMLVQLTDKDFPQEDKSPLSDLEKKRAEKVIEIARMVKALNSLPGGFEDTVFRAAVQAAIPEHTFRWS